MIHLFIYLNELKTNLNGLSKQKKVLSEWMDLLIFSDNSIDRWASLRETRQQTFIKCIGRCGPQNQFFYACAKFPGSVHDARAVRCSELWRRWEHDNWSLSSSNMVNSSHHSQCQCQHFSFGCCCRIIWANTPKNMIYCRKFNRHT